MSSVSAPHAADEAPKGRVDWVVDRLRDGILLGEFAPGERVRTVHLAAEWNVSPTPIREAIQRLASEGLLVVQAQQGARVAPLSPQRALEILELRALLEPLLVRMSVERFEEEDRVRLAGVFDEYKQVWLGQTNLTPEMHRAYMRFSDALAARVDLPALTMYVRSLRMQSLRYGFWFTAAQRVEAHDRVTQAVLRRDPVGAMAGIVESLRPGLEWARDNVAVGVEPVRILSATHLEALRAITTMYPFTDER